MRVSMVRFTRSTESANVTRTSSVEDTFVLSSMSTRTIGGLQFPPFALSLTTSS